MCFGGELNPIKSLEAFLDECSQVETIQNKSDKDCTITITSELET